ncbi:MAG TPA: serine/threonine-protein kinase [Blastocatellia bacterium]|nr:serine/threonine-protein kinase [Blastocatellia bacterium]
MIGNVIGSFKITEKIGEGGMGAVFKGIDTMLEREVAIKMLRPELSSQPEVVERFRSEAVTLAKLNHPNIATLYSFLRQGEDYFMVMEFVRGRTLDDVIRKFGAIDCNRAIVLFCQALEGIDHAHRMGIVHRDIKPANIMLTDTGSIKVMDFGIARVLGTARMTRQGNILGTVEYMAPEQVRGQAADARSDIYSLGILLYEMLTGRVPFESDSEFELMRAQVEDAPRPPRALLAEIPLPVEQAIMRALAKKPDARPQTAGEMRASLLSTLSASPTILQTAVPYAAPTTRVLETPAGLNTGERAEKKTLVSEEYPGATQILGGPSSSTNPPAEVPRATIAVHSNSVTGAGLRDQQTAVVAPSSTSLLARLNWKHYAAAAIVFIVLIAAAAFALRAMRGGDQPPQEEAASEEATPAPEASTPAPAEQTAAPAENPAAPNADAARVGGSPGDSNANVDRAARSRANRNEQVTETQSAAGAPPAAAPAPAEAPQQPAASPPPAPDTSKKEPVVTATQNVNKNQPKDEKKGGFGGFFKKVFGGSDKKNDNKNKNKKE